MVSIGKEGLAMKGILIDLPKTIPIKLRNGVDRYGFSYVLAQRCNRRKPPRSFAFWIHGWRNTKGFPESKLTAELLACQYLPKDTTIVVRNDVEKQVVVREGFSDVLIGGLPFAYIKQQHSKRHKDCLLTFLPHSVEFVRTKSDQKQYMDYLESLKNDFESIYVSLYSIDNLGPMEKAAKHRGLNTIQCAKPDDRNSLFRIRSILDSFEYVTTNVWGSHMLYALYSGCKFSFTGPIYEYKEELFSTKKVNNIYSKKSHESLEYLQSEEYLRSNYSYFFKDNPKQGINDLVFAKEEIGEKNLLTKPQIEKALGWSLKDQVKGYGLGGIRRLLRTI